MRKINKNIIEIQEEVTIGNQILEVGDKIEIISEDTSTNVYPVFTGGNSYSLKLTPYNSDISYSINGSVEDIANQIKDIFKSNVSVTEIMTALEKKGRGAFFIVTKPETVVISGLESLSN